MRILRVSRRNVYIKIMLTIEMCESTQLQIDVTLYASDMTHNCLLIHHVDDVQRVYLVALYCNLIDRKMNIEEPTVCTTRTKNKMETQTSMHNRLIIHIQ